MLNLEVIGIISASLVTFVLSVQFAGPAYGGQPVMDAYGMNLGMNMGPPVCF